MPTQAEAERECEPTPSSPRTQRPLLNELDLDAHPLRVNVAYSSLVEQAVRRGDSIGYGVPEFVVDGYDDDLVSDASLSPPPSPAPVYRQESDEISQERIASAIEVAIQEKARRHSTAYAPFGSQSAVPRQGGRKHGAAKKTAVRNAGQTSEPGLKRRSQAGSRARKKKRKQEERVSLAQRPYDKVHDPSYYRRKFPVIAVSLKTLEVVYETVSSGYTAKVRPTKIRNRLWTDEDLRRAGAVHFPWDGKESVALIDASDICVGVLVAPPKDESFQNSGRAMADLIESQRSQRPQAWTCAPGKKRGDFPSLSAGMNYNFHEAVRRPRSRLPFPARLTQSSAPQEPGSQRGTTSRGEHPLRQPRRATHHRAHER
ncbi:hypothetical protein PENSPDRAFT_186554 [Peniophora sp. CONT]|nr:hypothetical protein PENSPDRAFT_186554 [Peniophora sp. CONT]